MDATSSTVSGSFALVKFSVREVEKPYSRSSSQVLDDNAPWRHYEQADLQLHLSKTVASDGSLRSVCVRVVWRVDAGRGSSEIELENVDLLHFSQVPDSANSLLHTATSRKRLVATADGLLVALRYQHPIEPTTGPETTYRRVQAKFQSAAAANQFADSIRDVCPFLQQKQRAGTVNSQVMGPPASQPKKSATRRPTVQVVKAPVQRWKQPSRTFEALAAPSSSSPAAVRSVSALDFSSTPPQFARTTGNSQGSQDTQMLDGPSSQHPAGLPQPVQEATQSSLISAGVSQQLAPVPQSSISHEVELQASPTAPQSDTHQVGAAQHMLTMLRSTPDLYQMPTSDLEQLVAQAIREEGFMDFLEKVESMWRIRGFVTR